VRVGHNAKTAAEAGLQPWLHGGGGGGEAACARLNIRKSSIGPRAGRPKGVHFVCDIFRSASSVQFHHEGRRTSRGDRCSANVRRGKTHPRKQRRSHNPAMSSDD